MVLREKLLTMSLLLLIFNSFMFGYHSKGYQYLYPKPDALHVDREAGLIIRFDKVSPYDIENLNNFINVDGQEGRHYTGSCKIASDERTILFKPDRPFQAGETLQVMLSPVVRKTGDATVAS